jgi:hypothetical protein
MRGLAGLRVPHPFSRSLRKGWVLARCVVDVVNTVPQVPARFLDGNLGAASACGGSSLASKTDANLGRQTAKSDEMTLPTVIKTRQSPTA